MYVNINLLRVPRACSENSCQNDWKRELSYIFILLRARRGLMNNFAVYPQR
jgi:hypothetical protein